MAPFHTEPRRARSRSPMNVFRNNARPQLKTRNWRPNAILEHINEDTDRRRTRRHGMDVDDYHQKREEDNEEDSEALFHWQDEKTLVADLMHNGDRRESTDDALHSLIDALQSPFDKRAKDLVNNIAVTLIPAAKRVRESHFRLNEEFDPTYSLAMLETDEAYKKNEAVVSTIHEQYSAACTASKERQFELMEQLKAACQERDALWNAFEARFQEAFGFAYENFKAIPVQLERSIAEYEKKSKQLNTDKGGGLEKKLKGLLG